MAASRKSKQNGGILRAIAAVALFSVIGALPLPAQLQVRVQNLAGVSDRAMGEVIRVGTRTFAAAGIDSRWGDLDSPFPDPAEVALGGASAGEPNGKSRRIVVRLTTSRHAFNPDPLNLGVALVSDGGGWLAVVYVDRAREFGMRYRLPLGRVLAYTVAHEVGHLLLGSTAHADEGLMRAFWDRRDADAMRREALYLDAGCAGQMAELLGVGRPAYALARVPDAELHHEER